MYLYILTAPESHMGNYLHDQLLIHTCLTISTSLYTVANHFKGEHAEGYEHSPYDWRCKKVSYYSAVSFRPMKKTNDNENYAEIVFFWSQQQNSCREQWGEKKRHLCYMFMALLLTCSVITACNLRPQFSSNLVLKYRDGHLSCWWKFLTNLALNC